MAILSSKESEKAYILATVSRCTYYLDKLHELEEIGVNSIEAFHIDSDKSWLGMSGLICRYGDYFIIAFRGSSDVDDWKKNFRAFTKSYNNSDESALSKFSNYGGKVHAGFAMTITSNWESLWSQVTRIYSLSNHKVLLAGHSLGGALAILFSLKMSSEVDKSLIDSLYTYGAPMVGDQEFINFFNSSTLFPHHRFEYESDPVPSTPTLPGYIPTGELHYLPKNKQDEILSQRTVPKIFRIGNGALNLLAKKINSSDITGVLGHAALEAEKLVQNHDIAGYTKHIKTYYMRNHPKAWVNSSFKAKQDKSNFIDNNTIYPW